jgi:parallel beta helix pectate lyase-like protein
MKMLPLRRLVLGAMFVLGLQATAYAQASRTWVSGVGDDANPCSRTAPCKTWAGAISKTAAGGEIDALDPGGFGAVTITKAITLASDGELASTLVSGTNGIVISAPATAHVTIRGLEVQGIDSGLSGIVFNSGGALHVEKCAIRQFTQHGILFQPNSPADLYVSDTDIGDNGGAGIQVAPTAGGVAAVVVDRVRATNNGAAGFRATGAGGGVFAHMTIHDSVGSGNGGPGFIAQSSGMPVRMMLSFDVASFNGVGFQADGSAATLWMGASVALANTTGMLATNSGSLLSYGDNQVNGNGTDGGPSAPVVGTK